MNNPTIKHKVCEYNGRLWAIHSAERKRSREGYADVILRLVDGDEVVFAEMTWKDYDAMNSKLEEQEFSLTPPSLVAALAADQEFPKWRRKPGSGGLVGQDKCANCDFPLVAHRNSLCPAKPPPLPPLPPRKLGLHPSPPPLPQRKPWENRGR